MEEDLSTTLCRIAQESLEGLAFLFSFAAEEREPLCFEGALAAKLTFSGAMQGTLFIVISAEVLSELAGNMLGSEGEEITEIQQHDALKELLNVICGNLLPAVAGTQAVCDIGMPVVLSPEEGGTLLAEHAPGAAARLDLDNGQADLYLFLES
jgi:hypothetical protein